MRGAWKKKAFALAFAALAALSLTTVATGRAAAGGGVDAAALIDGAKTAAARAEYGTVSVEGTQAEYAGVTLTGYEGTTFELGKVNLSAATTAKPVVSVLPQFWKRTVAGSAAEFFLKNGEVFRFYVELTSAVNPEKKLSFRLMPRVSDNNYETVITAAGETQTFTGVGWNDGKLNPLTSGTQKFCMDGTANTRNVINESGAAVTDPHPINLYYDYASNTVYAGSGVDNANVKTTTDDGLRFLIRRLDDGWTKFTAEEAADARVSVRFDTNVKREGRLLVTSLGGEPVTAAMQPVIREAGVGVELTPAAPSVTVAKSLMLADNDLTTKLAEVVVLPKEKGLPFSGTDQSGYKADFDTLTFGFTDGAETLNVTLSRRSDGVAQTLFTAGMAGEKTYGEDFTDTEKLSSTTATENSISLDGNARIANTIDENGTVIQGGAQSARFAVYYNAADNSLYTDCGRNNASKKSFTDAAGKTYYRWRILKLDKTYSNVARTLFAGFGTKPVQMTVSAQGITDNTVVKITYLDGQSLAYGPDGTLEEVYAGSGFAYLPRAERTAFVGEAYTLPKLAAHTLVGGVTDAAGTFTLRLTDPSGKETAATGASFTPAMYGAYTAAYYAGDKLVDTCSIVAGAKRPVSELEEAFSKVGTHADTYIRSTAYAALPDYMQFKGGGLKVETKNEDGNPDAHFIIQNQEGDYGLGVRFDNPVYIKNNRFRNAADYDSLIKLAFPAADERFKDKAQALVYKVVLEDAADPSIRLKIEMASGAGTDRVRIRAAGPGQKAGFLGTDGAFHLVDNYADGTALPGTLVTFDARSAAPVELCYDYADNKLYFVGGGSAAPIRELGKAYADDDAVFDGFPSGAVKISVGVDLSNRYNFIEDENGKTVMPYGSFTVLGLGGQNFTAAGGYFADVSDRLALTTGPALAGSDVAIEALELAGLFGRAAAPEGTIEVLRGAEVALAEEKFDGKNVFTPAKTGAYTVVYRGAGRALRSELTVLPSLQAEIAGSGVMTFNGEAAADGTFAPALPSNAIGLTPAAGYALSKLSVNGEDVTGSVENGRYALTFESGDTALVSAVFTAVSYTIEYRPGDGTLTGPKTERFTVEDVTLVLPAAALEHYDFLGWYDGTTQVTAGAFEFPARNLTLTAKYAPHAYTITYDPNYAGGEAETAEFTVLNYEVFVLKDEPDALRPGDWYFEGWYSEAEGGALVTGIVSPADLTVYGRWTEGFTVTFKADDALYKDIRVKSGTAVTRPEDPEKTGHAFTGWEADGAAYDFTAAVTGNLTLHAAFIPLEYDVTFVIEGEKTVVKAKYGDKLSDLEAPALPDKPGYAQTPPAWSLGGDTVVEGDLTVAAVYTADVYTVTFDSDGGTAIPEAEVEYGAFITAPAQPEKEGYTFTGWYTADGEKFVFGVTADGDLTLKAGWKANEVPVVDPPPSEKKCGCGGSAAAAAATSALPLLAATAVLLMRKRRSGHAG